MTTNALTHPPEADAPPWTRWAGAWARFWFSPAAPTGLHCIRFLAGLLFLSWLLPVTSERAALFSLSGWFDRQAYLAASRLPENALPVPIGWSLTYLAGENAAAFEVLWWGSIAVLVLFTLGVATRLTAPLTWLIVVSFIASPASHADTDYVLGILAFYLMIGYLLLGQWGRPLSLLERLLGPRGTSVFGALRGRGAGEEAPPSYAAHFALRLLQVHFAILVVSSALHKLQFGDWWSGVAFWYPLHPPLSTEAPRIDAERASRDFTLFFLSLSAYAVLAWEMTFPLFAFRRRLRPVLLTGAAIAWLGTMLLYGDMTFGATYALGCLSYLTPQEWRRVTGLIGRPLERRAAATAPERVKAGA